MAPPTQKLVNLPRAEVQYRGVGAILDTCPERALDHGGREAKVEGWVVGTGSLSIFIAGDDDGVRRCHADEASIS